MRYPTIGDLDEQNLEDWTDLAVADLEERTTFGIVDGTDGIVLELLAGRSSLERIRPDLEPRKIGAEPDTETYIQ
ncbi:hypothetical protein C477_14098 [Haloterrigena salina JCM 13891]|uniref:Uncharacterized protein n=1 Tax=Haloterrigena salina JCM 13891 TaxID=1227488 RepID=M0C302_9EURY|nr:hypothetical protein [Haloterrigena salina]ELZ17018.1 hypothetical protein C477_14098 [Haloterrigena salina JCM 13891]